MSRTLVIVFVVNRRSENSISASLWQLNCCHFQSRVSWVQTCLPSMGPFMYFTEESEVDLETTMYPRRLRLAESSSWSRRSSSSWCFSIPLSAPWHSCHRHSDSWEERLLENSSPTVNFFRTRSSDLWSEFLLLFSFSLRRLQRPSLWRWSALTVRTSVVLFFLNETWVFPRIRDTSYSLWSLSEVNSSVSPCPLTSNPCQASHSDSHGSQYWDLSHQYHRVSHASIGKRRISKSLCCCNSSWHVQLADCHGVASCRSSNRISRTYDILHHVHERVEDGQGSQFSRFPQNPH